MSWGVRYLSSCNLATSVVACVFTSLSRFRLEIPGRPTHAVARTSETRTYFQLDVEPTPGTKDDKELYIEDAPNHHDVKRFAKVTPNLYFILCK